MAQLPVIPCYEKQYIRFATTFYAPADKQTPGTGGDVTIGDFAVVSQATYAGAKFAATAENFNDVPTEVLGVNQAMVPMAKDYPNNNRSMCVAESGLLLVRVGAEQGSAPIEPRALSINAKGYAVALDKNPVSGPAVAFAVTKGGKSPMVREYFSTGGQAFVLVSFD